MSLRLRLFLSGSALAVFALPAFSALASSSYVPDFVNLPETAGIYSVPGNSRLKLRVFVHEPGRANPAKPIPSPTPAPTLNCTLTDPDSASVVGLTGWSLPAGEWTYRLNPSSNPSLAAALPEIAENSFSAWTASDFSDLGDSVSFRQVSDTTAVRATYDGQNIIAWGRTSGSALAVTYTWYYPDIGLAVETDTIFNKKFPWSWSGGSTQCAYQGVYDAQEILVHELGHWFGLDDEYTSEFVDNTMFGYGSTGEVKKNTPASGDFSALNSLY